MVIIAVRKHIQVVWKHIASFQVVSHSEDQSMFVSIVHVMQIYELKLSMLLMYHMPLCLQGDAKMMRKLRREVGLAS